MVKVLEGGVAVDDRGQLSFVNDFDFKDVKRFYMVDNHEKGFIRAWHGHKKEGKYVFVPNGAILIGCVNLETEEIDRFVLSSSKPQVLYIPPGYANGFMNLQNNTKVMFFSTSTLEDSLGDDIRFEWDKWNIWNIERR